MKTGRERTVTATEATVSSAPSQTATPRWPLVAAPFAGSVYYLVLLIAFWGKLPNLNTPYVLPHVDNDLPVLTWGNHWIYHTLAEVVSVCFGTFIAAGLARERAAIGGLLGGFGIIAVIILRLYRSRRKRPQ